MELPDTYYEMQVRTNPRLFHFLRKDLRRLEANPTLVVQDILPPLGECEEVAYVRSTLAYMQEHPERYGWLHNRATHAAVLDAMIRDYRFLLAYEHAGRKTYYFSEPLTEQLCYTALNMNCDQLRLPFSSFAFVYDSAEAVEAVHSILKRPVEPGETVTVLVREDDLEQVGFPRLMFAIYVHRGDTAVAQVSRQLAMRPDWTLEQALRTDWDKVNMPSPPERFAPVARLAAEGDGDFEIDADEMEVFFDEGLRFVRLLLNSILYVTSRDAELAERLTRRKVRPAKAAHAKSRNFEKRQYWVAGQSVEPLPIVIDPLRAPASGRPLRREGRRVQVRFLVSGFWRRKPGAGQDAPKDVWVKPHHRGPEMADLINRPYVVR
ncbi:hypothetical protein [Ralstonia pseudosolanacearum]|uniref:hypothetical protein n=1 Tax=Ralstonia pseudosolanacearum TaxID=1310165 RepID=UPI001FF8EB96|nr:hypothetical protein [Ralstonia pseudosolanacearum]